MKFLHFAMFEFAKAADVAQAMDKFWAKPPTGLKVLATYACLGMPFPDVPPNTGVAVDVIEAESAEALAALSYTAGLAGVSGWNVPVMELPVGGAAKLEKKYRPSTR